MTGECEKAWAAPALRPLHHHSRTVAGRHRMQKQRRRRRLAREGRGEAQVGVGQRRPQQAVAEQWKRRAKAGADRLRRRNTQTAVGVVGRAGLTLR